MVTTIKCIKNSIKNFKTSTNASESSNPARIQSQDGDSYRYTTWEVDQIPIKLITLTKQIEPRTRKNQTFNPTNGILEKQWIFKNIPT